MNMPDSCFTLRVAVKTLGEEPVAGLEPNAGFQVGVVRVTINQKGRYLILKADNFATELLIRLDEVLSGIPDPLVLKVAAHTLG